MMNKKDLEFICSIMGISVGMPVVGDDAYYVAGGVHYLIGLKDNSFFIVRALGEPTYDYDLKVLLSDPELVNKVRGWMRSCEDDDE